MITASREFFNSAKGRIVLILIIFILAFMLRIPKYSYPETTIGDEGIFATFTLNTVYKIPFFEIHPPLFRMISATLVAPDNPSWHRWTHIGEQFGDFPYKKIRLFNIVLGSLLPVIIFGIGLALRYSVGQSIVPAFFVIFDTMFIQYSGIGLSDSLLWFTGFLGILFLLSVERAQPYRCVWLCTICSGLLFGLSMLVKWTGAGFLAVGIFFLIQRQSFRYIIPLLLTSLGVYVAVSFIYFSQFKPGNIQVERSYYETEYVAALRIPEKKNLATLSALFVDYHKVMFRVNTDSILLESISRTGSPYHWPLGMAPHGFWAEKNIRIYMTVNPFPWILGFLSVIGAVYVVVRGIKSKLKIVSQPEALLLAGYLLNYIPFFFISMSRPMFIYHYGISLVFALLLILLMYNRLITSFSEVRVFRSKALIYTIFAIILLGFIVVAPFTYGLPIEILY